jgi:hypothetical protein
MVLALLSTLAMACSNDGGPSDPPVSPTPDPSDTEAPTFAGIETATDGGDGTATLGWSAASDNISDPANITYLIYASGNLSNAIGEVTGETSFVTAYAAPGAYEWTVRAQDEASNTDTNTQTAGATITVPTVTFATDVAPLFDPTCTAASCHDARRRPGLVHLPEAH